VVVDVFLWKVRVGHDMAVIIDVVAVIQRGRSDKKWGNRLPTIKQVDGRSLTSTGIPGPTSPTSKSSSTLFSRNIIHSYLWSNPR
jgi:hypothetical protein